MKLTNLNCSNCGANLTVFTSLNRAICESCGSNYLIENCEDQDFSQSLSNDNPISIRYVMKTTPTLVIQVTEDPDDRGVQPVQMEKDYLENILKIISGCAYVLGQNYKVIIESGFTYTDYIDNTISAFDIKEKGTIRKYNKAQKVLSDNYISEFTNMAEPFDISVHDETQKNTAHRNIYIKWKNYDCVEHHVYGTLVVSPSYMEKHYPMVKKNLDRIRQYKEITLIANECIKYIFSDSNACILTNSNTTTINGDPNKSHHHPGSGIKEFAFKEFGMDKAPDIDAIAAIHVATIEKIIQSTKEDNTYLWDLTNGYSIDRSLLRTGIGHFETTIGFLKETIKEYKSW